MSSIIVEHSTKTAEDLLAELRTNELIVPPHQREFCWKLLKQQRFVDTVQKSMPTQAIIVRNEIGIKPSLEDGQQRLTTLRRYFADEFVDSGGKKFSEHSAIEQYQMRRYTFALIRYKNASTEDAIEIFDRFQNGQPLSVGERVHSMSDISPFVKFVRETLLTVGSGLHDRAAAIWGPRAGMDKNRKNLLNAVALCAGCAFGTGAMTTKWEDIRRLKILSRSDWAAPDIRSLLTELIHIYEQVEAKSSALATVRKKQWDVGRFSGYLLHSLKLEPRPAGLVPKWVDFLVKARDDPDLIDEVLHIDQGKARFWTTNRWKMGYLRVFDPDEAERLVDEGSSEEGSEEGSEDD
jgi:hypothetical protein